MVRNAQAMVRNMPRTSRGARATACRSDRSRFRTKQTEGRRNMLILTRRTGETVMIGNEVTFTVLGVKGNQVRLGINAPKDVPVHREEVYERIKQERGEANGSVAEEGPRR